MATATAGAQVDPTSFAVPRGTGGLLASIIAQPFVPHVAARAGAWFAARADGPVRIGGTTVVASHRDVREALARDLDFRIAPINAERIQDVDDSFVLGMDRGALLGAERDALYRALSQVDVNPIADRANGEADRRIAAASRLDVVTEFARPIAAATAKALFGLGRAPDHMFEPAVRSIFRHTFLNVGGDPDVRQRAKVAASLLRTWLDDEISERRGRGSEEADMMGAMLRMKALDDAGVRRTLAGMVVGAVDTTASSVAKIITMYCRHRHLREGMMAAAGRIGIVRGWCWEALRLWPHNPILLRRAHAATTLGGRRVRAGERLALWTQAAMWDPAAFPEPMRLRPDRPVSSYLHFGGGIHLCAGRSVNAWQIPLLVDALVRRGIDRADAIGWAGPFPDRLIVRFTK